MLKLIFSLSATSFLGYGIGFINQTIIARKFGTSEELDIYLLALSVVNFGWLFIGPINEISIPDFFKNAKLSNEEGSIYFSKVLNVILLFSIVMSACIYIFSSHIFIFLRTSTDISYNQFKEYIIFLLPIIFLTAITQYFQVVLNSLSKYIAQSIGKIVTASISVLFLIFYYESLGIEAIIFGMILGLLLLAFLQYYFIYNLKIFYRPLLGIVTDIIYHKNIFLLSFTYLLSALQVLYEKYVFLSFGNGVLSSYTYSQTLLQVPQMILVTGVLAIVSTNFMSNLHEDDLDKGLDKLFTVALNTFVISFLISITISIYSEEIIYILFFGGEFNNVSLDQTSDILFILIYAFPFLVLSSILGRAFVVLKKIKLLSWINIFSALSLMLILFLSALMKSITLGVCSFIITNLIIVIFKLIIYKNLYKFKGISTNLVNRVSVKNLFILFLYALLLFLLKKILNIDIGVNKLLVIKELVLVGIIFFLCVGIYFKLNYKSFV